MVDGVDLLLPIRLVRDMRGVRAIAPLFLGPLWGAARAMSC